MKILVCGGRDYQNWSKACQVLNDLHKDITITSLVSGRARGADAMGEQWAVLIKIKVLPYPADWIKYGKAAGPIRNQLMLDDNPDLGICVAFPGSSGTADMIRRAKSRGLKIIEVVA